MNRNDHLPPPDTPLYHTRVQGDEMSVIVVATNFEDPEGSLGQQYARQISANEKFTSAADAAMATPPPPVQADIETAIPETPPPPPRRKPKKPTTLGGKVKRIAGGLLRRALGRGPSQNQ